VVLGAGPPMLPPGCEGDEKEAGAPGGWQLAMRGAREAFTGLGHEYSDPSPLPGMVPPWAPPEQIETDVYGVVQLPTAVEEGVAPPPPPPQGLQGEGVSPPPPAPPKALQGECVSHPPPPPTMAQEEEAVPPPPLPELACEGGEGGGGGVPPPPPPRVHEGEGVAPPPPPPQVLQGEGVAPPPPPPQVLQGEGDTPSPDAPPLPPPPTEPTSVTATSTAGIDWRKRHNSMEWRAGACCACVAYALLMCC
jgi:hypothetical protein